VSDARRYIVLTPLRNEIEHLEVTVASILRQTVPPALWLVLDDGSSDGSAAAIARHAARHPWIRLVRLPDRGRDLVGRGVAEVMNRGLRLVAAESGEFIAKLDADVDLPADYFERLLALCGSDPTVSLCSGHPYTFESGRRLIERHADFFPSGTARLYRRRRLEEIGGFVASVGWDTVDILKLRMRGDRTRVLHDLPYHHLRRMGTRNGYIDGMVRDGRNAYLTGYGTVFFLCRAAVNARYRPWLLRSACMLWGFAGAAVRRLPRIVNDEEMRFHRSLQRQRLRLRRID
jgi:glycosyltransferase involved in cell wall biosynthesis